LSDKDLKKAGLKATVPRVKILAILEEAGAKHLSAEDIYKIMLVHGDDIGLATIYRVLTQFESSGMLIRHNFDGGHSVFELDHGQHHDHIVCIKCGKVVEFIDEIIEERQHVIAKEKGFKMTDHSLYIYGVCKECSA